MKVVTFEVPAEFKDGGYESYIDPALVYGTVIHAEFGMAMQGKEGFHPATIIVDY